MYVFIEMLHIIMSSLRNDFGYNNYYVIFMTAVTLLGVRLCLFEFNYFFLFADLFIPLLPYSVGIKIKLVSCKIYNNILKKS